MKSLVLKDLFNIGHNAKSMLFILVVFAVALIPFSGVEGYIFVCAILCSMMIVTTFSFDDSSKWTRYAICLLYTSTCQLCFSVLRRGLIRVNLIYSGNLSGQTELVCK